MLSMKSLITTIPSTAFNGWLNDAFVPNCKPCRDALGHLCADLDVAAHACRSSRGACVGGGYSPALANLSGADASCPASCEACPGWHGDASTMWLIVLLTSAPAVCPQISNLGASLTGQPQAQSTCSATGAALWSLDGRRLLPVSYASQGRRGAPPQLRGHL